MILRVIIIMIILCFFTTNKLFAQNYPTISILLIDNYTSKQISSVDSIIFYNSKDRFVYKDIKINNGECVIKKIKPSNYKIEINCIGYQKLKSDINISYANNQRIILRLYIKHDNSDTSKIQKIMLIEEPPDYPGGNYALEQFLKKNLNISLIKSIYSNKFYYAFTIDTLGKPINIKLINIKGVEFGTDMSGVQNEIERVLNLMPAWKPAKNGGKNVQCEFTLPLQ